MPPKTTYSSDKDLAIRLRASRQSIWRWSAHDPNFPKPIRLSPGCTRWRDDEIAAWEAARPRTRC